MLFGMPISYLLFSELIQLFCSTIFYPEYSIDELAAHIYLRSVHNISIERSWLRLRLDWGDNVVIFFNKGIEDGVYNPNNPQQ